MNFLQDFWSTNSSNIYIYIWPNIPINLINLIICSFFQTQTCRPIHFWFQIPPLVPGADQASVDLCSLKETTFWPKSPELHPQLPQCFFPRSVVRLSPQQSCRCRDKKMDKAPPRSLQWLWNQIYSNRHHYLKVFCGRLVQRFRKDCTLDKAKKSCVL